MSRPIHLLLSVALAIGLLAGMASAQSNLANCKYYTKTQEDFEQGFDYCRECITDEPDNPEARYYGAWCLAEVGMYDEAWVSFAWLLERKDSKSKKVRKHSKWAGERVQAYFAQHFNKGVEYLKAEDYVNANDEFRQATQIYPTKAAGYLNYGFTQNQLNDLDGAIESFRRAVEIRPDNPTGHEYLSVALGNKVIQMRSQDPVNTAELDAYETELKETLLEVLESAPANDAAMLQLADLELAAGNRAKAFEYIEQSVDIDPENLVELFNMGVGFYSEEKWDAAIEAFGKTAELVDDPDDDLWVDSMLNMALAQSAAESWDDCIVTVTELLEVNPNSIEYHSLCGQAYMKKGEKDKALEHFQRADELERASIEGSPGGTP